MLRVMEHKISEGHTYKMPSMKRSKCRQGIILDRILDGFGSSLALIGCIRVQKIEIFDELLSGIGWALRSGIHHRLYGDQGDKDRIFKSADGILKREIIKGSGGSE
jgi:hypothetical protein